MGGGRLYPAGCELWEVTLTPALSRRGRGGKTPRPRTPLEGGLSAYDTGFVVLARRWCVGLITLDGGILSGAGDVAVGLGE